MQQPAWMAPAWSELGQHEVPGAAANPRIRALYDAVGHDGVEHDEVAWCAAFAGAMLERAGIASTRSLLARSCLGWGNGLAEPRAGAICVLSRGGDPALGHVGFWIGETADSVVLLGGNQDDAVTVACFAKDRLLGCRWPQAATSGALFETALAHVLEVEGGYTDDPYDPGGPTNHGITLADYAAHRHVEVTPETFAALKAELQRIPAAVVREIYLKRYWIPSRAAELPPQLGLMHFDAAVNHGLGTAARLLQGAVGASVDGEIGPETLAAARSASPIEALERYAEARRQRYRQLGHFWRFGRGWLNRVEKTLGRARALPAALSRPPLSASEGDTPMPEIQTQETTTEPTPSKWWGQSMTIWGALLTALSTVLPVIGPLVGLDLTADLVRQLGEQIVQVAQALGGLIGIIMTIYGRTRATTRLERRELTLQL